MTTSTFDLFGQGIAAQQKTGSEVGFRADGSVLLVLGSAEPADPCELGKLPREPLTLHYHPLKQDTLPEVLQRIKELKQLNLAIHGLSPGWVDRHGRDALRAAQEAGLDSLAWCSGGIGETSPAANGWEALQDFDIPKVASFTYSPRDSAEQIEERIAKLAAGRNVQTLSPLPASVGDMVVVKDLTTDGLQDVTVLIRCRLQCNCHVRASWAALGWKMAQSTLGFGVDELTGWGLEEFLAYSQRLRPSSVIGREEVLAGIKEAGRRPREVRKCTWDS